MINDQKCNEEVINNLKIYHAYIPGSGENIVTDLFHGLKTFCLSFTFTGE